MQNTSLSRILSALAFYVGSIVLVNVLFAYVPMLDLGTLGMLSPVALIVGCVFVIRDYTQRAAGHWVLAGMACGVILSYMMANPYVATASAIAFILSEGADYAIYTASKQPFHKRVLWSSAISTPIDTIAFLWFIDALSVGTVVLMVLSKMVAALLIWYTHRETVTIDMPYGRLG